MVNAAMVLAGAATLGAYLDSWLAGIGIFLIAFALIEHPGPRA